MAVADDDDLDEDLEESFADESATVECPYCGEWIEIALDPGGGTTQEYVDDCEVCCRPVNVRVHYDADGHAYVEVDASED